MVAYVREHVADRARELTVDDLLSQFVPRGSPVMMACSTSRTSSLRP